MAPSRGKGKGRAAPPRNATAGPSQRTTRATRRPKDETPDVYQDMLAEAAVTDPDELSDRPPKRRRVATSVTLPSPGPSRHGKARQVESSDPVSVDGASTTKQQTIDASSDDSDESDFAFEDVDLDQPTGSRTDDGGIADVSISVNPNTTPKRQAKVKRKGASLVEKAHRLLVHKAHVLCLLGHCIYINSWCNNEVVHRNLEPLLTEKTKVFLRANSRESQFDRNNMFIDGLQQAVEQFRGRFRVTASGMRRARWVVEGEAALDAAAKVDGEVVDRSDFIRASRRLEGSQDTGNQLFCALLRTVGVDARLVCSLQVLPFANAPAKSTPQKVVKRTIFASHSASNTDHSASEASADDISVRSSTSIGKVPPARRRLGQLSFTTSTTAAPPPPAEQRKPIRKLAYPVFWTEAFNAAHQKWIPCDPLVTATTAKPAKLEPPSSYDANQLGYALAFEADGVAKDVTRRYAKAFNAKTRRQRVEATENGTAWFRKALRVFRRRGGGAALLDREQVEDAELAQKEAREGLPGNVLDFRGHPYYALERHLRRHEVLFPRREVGKVNAGTAARPRMEAVFRRQDVRVCRSAEKWYRVGREVRAGEVGLKVVKAARRLGRAVEVEEDEDGEGVRMTALYALHQTEVYIPPPVVDGRVPRNAYGNLDIYVPSMVPAGGVHLRHPLTQVAARQLGIDFADAVTGFSFKGRQGTAIVEGAVVAEMHAEAVRETIAGLEREEVEERSRKRSLVALALWARMMKGLGIRERVRGYAKKDEGGGDKEMGVDEESVTAALVAGARDDAPLLTAGRYTLEELLAGLAKGSLGKKKKKWRVEESEVESESDREEGGFDRGGDVSEESEPVLSVRRSVRNRRTVDEAEDEDEVEEMLEAKQADGEGGGFLTENAVEDGEGSGGLVPEETAQEDDDDGGGFVPENHEGGGGFLAHDVGGDGEHSGGGFLPDASDHQQDGGFLPDAAGSPLGDEDPPAQAPSSASREHTDGMHGTMSPAALSSKSELVGDQALLGHHATTLDGRNGQLAVQPMNAHGTPPSYDGCADPVDVAQRNVQTRPRDSPANPGNAARQLERAGSPSKHETIEAGSRGVGDESDKGSLLSHDPEDEDAEPDWLESD
ncbi:hypothetical protein B0A55_03369 [Friedmanniomyces simplex]|uniref:Rad4 beta-hairpin domain-containing protein n=1 Tax=Friedmanniomyces simplex TaxID=329884 RepID=A0A4U0XSJ9_9PEZI|nr:hypothetical protein B0A55_03369 [Friedmanniomyces simplex]